MRMKTCGMCGTHNYHYSERCFSCGNRLSITYPKYRFIMDRQTASVTRSIALVLLMAVVTACILRTDDATARLRTVADRFQAQENVDRLEDGGGKLGAYIALKARSATNHLEQVQPNVRGLESFGTFPAKTALIRARFTSLQMQEKTLTDAGFGEKAAAIRRDTSMNIKWPQVRNTLQETRTQLDTKTAAFKTHLDSLLAKLGF